MVLTGPGSLDNIWSFDNIVWLLAPTITYFFGYGLHTVVLNGTDSWGDAATEVFPVAVFASLVVNASLSSRNGTVPYTVTFRANASGGFGPPYRFRWTFGDGAVATNPNATHTFDVPGTYRVTLNVTDAGGASRVEGWNVTVAPDDVPLILLIVGAATGVVVALAVAARRRRPSSSLGP